MSKTSLPGLMCKVAAIPHFSTWLVLLLMVSVNVCLQPDFFSPDVIESNLATFTPLILISMAQALVIIVGGIDLSVGATVALLNVVLASLMATDGASVAMAIGAMLIVAILVGAANGLAVGYLRLPAMLSTLATSSVWFGLSLFMMPQPGGFVPDFYYQLYQARIFNLLPVPVLILAFAFAAWHLVKTRPLFRYLYAVGGNEESARASGIDISKTRLMTMVLAAFFLSIGALVVTAQTASGDARVGQAFTLTSIAAAVIGGTALKGGRGTLLGATLGACILGLLGNVIFFANLPSIYQEFIKGLIIIVSLGVGVWPGFGKMTLRKIAGRTG